MEFKRLSLEFKEISTGKRTATIAHAVYDNIDRGGDISRKGMFAKSWKENKSIDFLFNHDPKLVPGKVTGTFEDDKRAYTEVKFGNWTLGNDVMEMADSGVLKGASFGYITEKKDYQNIKGRKIRELKEVRHIETSLLTEDPMNPEAGLVSLQKSIQGLGIELKTLSTSEQDALKRILSNDQTAIEQLIMLSGSLDVTSDLYTWINWNISQRASMIGDIRSQLKWNAEQMQAAKSYVERIDNFCRNSKASDECIYNLEKDSMAVKKVLTQYDTAFTLTRALEPEASVTDDNTTLAMLALLNAKIN